MFVFDWVKACLLEGRVGCPSEIAKFKYVEAIENVLRFDISMDDIEAVQVADCSCDLPEIEGG